MLHITKPALPKGLSYVLKTSALEQALHASRVECDVELRFWKPTQVGSVLEAYFRKPTPDIPRTRFHVRAGPVPSSDRPRAEIHVFVHEDDEAASND